MKRLSTILAVLMISQTLLAAQAEDKVAANQVRPVAPVADVSTQLLTVYKETYDACYKGQGVPAPSFTGTPDPLANIRKSFELDGLSDTH